MRLLAAVPADPSPDSEIETIVLSPDQLAYLDSLSREFNPAVPPDFGRAHAVRLLLERLEEASLDNGEASTEPGGRR